MDRFQQNRSSRRREKPGKLEAARGAGNKHIKSRRSSHNSISTEKNSLSFELRQSSLEEVSKPAVTSLLAGEMPKEMEIRQHSPSIIAKLMGLDALPTQQPAHKQHKKVSNSCSQRMVSITSQEKCKCASHGEYSCQKNRSDQHQFKDVFEVMESSNADRYNNQMVQKGMWTSELSDVKMDFIKKKFMDAKHLSTDENLRQSKEFHDALEALNSNKDLLLKFLQEPDSLFNKHLHNLHIVPTSSQRSYIKTSKSSTISNYSNGTFCTSQGKMEGRERIWRDLGSSLRGKNHVIHNGHTVSLNDRSVRSPHEGKTETCHLATRIVVLKPNLWNQKNKERAISSPRSLASSHSRRRELMSGSLESVTESRDQMNLASNAELSRSRKSRKIAREITQRMKQSAGGSKIVSASVLKGYAGDESSCSISGKESTNESEASSSNSTNLYGRNKMFSRMAKKHLSERLKTTHTCQQVGIINRGPSTLREMLALSDKETEQKNLDSFTGQSYSGDWLTRRDSVERRGYPLGISSKDGWKVGPPRSLTRSRSLPSSSSFDRRPKISIRHETCTKDDSFMLKENINLGLGKVVVFDSFNKKEKASPRNTNFCERRTQSFLHEGQENSTIREIHASPNELRKLEDRDKSERCHIVPKKFVGVISNTRQLADGIPLSEGEDMMFPFKIQEEQLLEPTNHITLVKDSAKPNQTDQIAEETPQNDSLSVFHCHVKEPDSPQSSQEVDQPSPVSVLEPPFEDVSCSDCFESISADLQGLRMQLRLLKLESRVTFVEGSESTLLSDEDAGEESGGLAEKKGDFSGMFREENRNYSYLIDVMSELGLYGADYEGLKGRLHSLEFPAGRSVFENLENKYGRLMSWPRSERRLLFDQIYAGLVEILGPHSDIHPTVKLTSRRGADAWDSESLLEKMWHFLVKCGREENRYMEDIFLGWEARWLNMGDEVDAVGKEIEKFLINELIEEFVQELSSRR